MLKYESVFISNKFMMVYDLYGRVMKITLEETKRMHIKYVIILLIVKKGS